MAFYPFLHPQTDSPEKKKLNLIGNKAILIRTLRHYLPTIPHLPQCNFKNNVDIKYAVSLVNKYLLTFHSFSAFIGRAVNGSNYLFGEIVSLIDFIKVRTVYESCLCFPSVFWLGTCHCSVLNCAFMSRS